MGRFVLGACLLAAAAGVVWLLLGGLGPSGLDAGREGGEGIDEVAVAEDVRLRGVDRAEASPVGSGEVSDAEADLPTVLERLETRYRWNETEVRPSLAARLQTLVREDPTLVQHLVRVGLGLEKPASPPWPTYFRGLLNTWDLRSVGVLGAACVPVLREAWLESEDPRRRSAVLGMIQKRLGRLASPLMPEMAKVLREGGGPERLQWEVIHTARTFGGGAAEIGPDLLARARDADDPLHQASLCALVDIVGMTPEVVGLYEGVLLHATVHERLALIDGAFGSLQRSDVEPLRAVWVSMLAEREPLIQAKGIAALAGIGVKTAEERRTLLHLAQSPNADVRKDASEVLALCAGEPGQAALLELLSSTEDYDVKWCGMLSLDRAGVPVVDRKELVLVEFEDMETLGVPEAAVRLLAHASKKPRVVDYFAWMKKHALDPESPLRDRMPSLLANLQGDDEAVVDFLLERAEAGGREAGRWIRVVTRYPSQAARLVPWLETTARGQERANWEIIAACCDALARLGATDRAAKAALERLHRGDDPVVRVYAASSLGLPEEPLPPREPPR